jgi:cell division protein FtsL
MIRVLNFFCLAAMGLSILALYHVSEATRVAQMRLDQTGRQIASERATIGVLQTEWERVAGPARIQALAQSQLGMSDTTSVQLSSFDQLPVRGDGADAALNNTPLHNASAQVPAAAPIQVQEVADQSGL